MSKYKLSAGAYELLWASGDLDAFLKKAHYAGATHCRFFAEAAWHILKNDIVAPFKMRGGKFDLSVWDERYWDKLKYVLYLMKKWSIRPHIVLFDFCSWKMKLPWRKFVPWFNSAQDPTNAHLTGTLLAYEKRYLRRIVEECAALGLDAEYEICNEYYWPGWTLKQGQSWHKAIADTLIGEGVPKKNIITSVNWKLDMDILTSFAAQVGTYAFHGAGGRDGEILWRAVEAMKKYGSPELSSDGVFEGQGAADNEGHRGNSPAEMVKIARLMKKHGITRYDFKDRGISDKTTESTLTECGVISNVDLADLAPLTAMAKELGLSIPTPPKPKPEPKPEPEPTPEPDPVPAPDPEPEPEPEPIPEHKSCYQKYISGRPIRLWKVGRFLSCLLGGK